MKRSKLLWLWCVWLLIGCSQAPQPIQTAAVIPQDWQPVQQGGVALALPPGWQVMTADDIDLPGAIDAAATANPQLGTTVQGARQALSQGQVKLVAYDLEPEHMTVVAYPTNVSVGVVAAGGATLAQLRDANLAQLRSGPSFAELQQHDATVAGLPAVRFSYTLTINDPGGTALPLHVDQYLWLRGDNQYIMTFSTTPAQYATFAPSFRQVLDTVRLTGK